MSAQFSVVLSQSTRLTDRQTDGQKDLGNTVRRITCSRAVITYNERFLRRLPVFSQKGHTARGVSRGWRPPAICDSPRFLKVSGRPAGTFRT